MKSSIILSFIVCLIVIFVIADRKLFLRNNDIQSIQSGTMERTVTETTASGSASEMTAMVTPAQTIADELDKTNRLEQDAGMTLAIKDRHEDKQSEAFAMPVETRGVNSEKNNLEQAQPAEQENKYRDYVLAYSENFQDLDTVPLSKANEEQLVKKEYDLNAFKKILFPKFWNIDFSGMPPAVSFEALEEGYRITSDKGDIMISGQRFNGMISTFIFEASVENPDDKECVISLGVNNSGLIKKGNTVLVTDRIPGKEKKTITMEINVFDRFANIAPTLTINGAILLTKFNIYRKDHHSFTIVEGEIAERSNLPAPKDTDYPDCRYTAHFVGNAILSGMPCNKELSLSIDGFENKRVLGTASLNAGEKVRCAIVPIDSVPDELASIQEADDLSLFALDSYLVTTLQKISSFTDVTTANSNNSIIYFKSDTFDFKSVFGRLNSPVPEELRNKQKMRVVKDLEEANKMIHYLEENRNAIEKEFQETWSLERDKAPDGYNRVGNLVWRRKNNSFWGLNYDYTLLPKKPRLLPKEKLDAIVALKDFLESNGIQLIVSLVPDRFEIASRVINSEFADVPVYQLASYVRQLSEAGVECPYNAKHIIDHYDLYPFAYLFPTDTHPGSTVQQCIAEIIADRLSDYHFPKDLDANLFSHVQVSTYDDDRNMKKLHKYPANCDIGSNPPDECYTSDEIRYEGKRVVRDTSSEILVIGNSFAFSPGSNLKQHSFPAFLSEQMLHPVDDYMVSSQGPMTVIIQRFFEKPESFLRNKKVLVLQMGAIHLNNNSVVWNNISEMDKKRLILNGKKLVASLSIQGNGNWTDSITNDQVRSVWGKFPGKTDYLCLDEESNLLLNQSVDDLDPAKPFLCVVQTVRSPIYTTPILSCNGIEAFIPASFHSSTLFWQDMYYSIPAGTTQIKLELQGKANTLVGFNKILIYQ